MIHKFLLASTQNITEQDASYLSENPLVVADEYDGGWWVRVPGDYFGNSDAKYDDRLQSLLAYGFSQSLLTAFKYAADRDCEVINFDMDADPVPGLIVNEW